ncbi:hypothetical protein [Sutcliffiella horikoshii]|uniref:hypothetical protein n=1 Tax=Sutcliffiella horikoshii TaxID=79883 RepID=UPI001CFD41D6|nr:hypothetical protein [Sutcliffiella horikoshii]
MSLLELEKPLQEFYGAKMEIVVIDEGEEDVEVLEETLEASQNAPFAAQVSSEYIEAQLENSVSSVGTMSHDPVKVMEKGILFGETISRQHYVHVLFGTI